MTTIGGQNALSDVQFLEFRVSDYMIFIGGQRGHISSRLRLLGIQKKRRSATGSVTPYPMSIGHGPCIARNMFMEEYPEEDQILGSATSIPQSFAYAFGPQPSLCTGQESVSSRLKRPSQR